MFAIELLKDDNFLATRFGFLYAINPFRYTDFLFQVGDFGISKILTSKSRASTVIGTPSYISPELCEGKHSVTFL